MDEIKKLIEKLARDWEGYKTANDERLEKMAKNDGVAEVREKLDKMDAAIDGFERKFEAAQLAAKRQGLGGDGGKLIDSQERKDLAAKMFRTGVKAITREEYKGLMEADPRFKAAIEQKSLTIDIDAQGGFLVRPEMSNKIIERIYETSPIRDLAEVVTISTSRYEMPYNDDEPETETQGVGERGTGGGVTSNATFGMVNIDVHNLFAKPRASMNYLQDAFIDIENWHQGAVARKFGRDEATWFIKGDGASQAQGILSYPNGTARGNLEQINMGSNSDVTADGLLDLQGSLFEAFQGNATWLLKRSTATAIRKLKDGDSRYLFSLTGRLDAPRLFDLLGNPMRYADDMPTVAANALAIAYGDFREGYCVVDRVGIMVIRDIYSDDHFVTFKTSKRVGGAVKQFQAIKLGKVAA